MRPTYIEMSAFGPYADVVKLDMDKLGSNGIYLITGDTGAGKTSIFDAVSFALFGEASGNIRENSMFRSKYAKPETPTYVRLDFVIGDKKYSITRNPEYLRPSKRGSGQTKQAANAQLILPDGSVIDSTSNVNKAVNDIMGIDKNKFSQIAMIAQGEFLSLITSKTEDRIKIFREIFKTEKFVDLQSKLGKNESELREKLSISKQNIMNALLDIKTEEYESEKNNLSGEDYVAAADIMKLACKAICADKERSNNYNEKLMLMNEELTVLNKRIGEAEITNNLFKTKADIDNNLVSCNEQFANAKAKLKEVSLYPQKIIDLNKELAVKESELAKYDEIDKLNNEITKLAQNLNKQQECIKDKEDHIKKLSEWLQMAKLELSELGNCDIDLVRCQNTRNDLIKEDAELKKLKDSINQLYSAGKDFDNKQAVYVDLRNKYNASKNISDKLELEYYDSQAGILAAKLEDGLPCPVCGSTTHPIPAHLSGNVLSKELLDEAKEKTQRVFEQFIESGNELSKDKAILLERYNTALITYNNIAGEINKVCSYIEDGQEFDKSVIDDGLEAITSYTRQLDVKMKEKLKAIDEEYNNAKTKVARKEQINNKLPETEKLYEEYRNEYNHLNSEYASNKLLYEQNIKQRDARKAELNIGDKNDALNAIKDLKVSISNKDEIYTKCEKEYNALNVQLTALLEKKEALEKNLCGKTMTDIHQLEEKKTLLTQEFNSINKVKSECDSRIQINTEINNKLEKLSAQIKDIENRYIWIKALSDTANGRITGKDKIYLETYIQMRYFERVIRRANVRLMNMTSGQYELKRSLNAADKRAQAGLELDVIDHYNGSVRSVKSLSGGESFKASLALALGLSDEVQSSYGGIRLESMFVDEGFGSLDEESLNLAIDTLSVLSESNKIVGIISHVESLRTRIDKQIIVSKKRSTGSNANIVV